MLSKKSSILSTACTALNAFPPTTASSTSSIRWRDGTRLHQCRVGEGKGYATIADDSHEHPATQEAGGKKKDDEPPPPWPKPLDGQTHPTPYQILAMKHNAVYTKATFYSLVKLYHPDLSHHDHNPSVPPTNPSSLTPRIKMERYRLVVAAHTILSDPTKRSAYDRFGAGWNGRAEGIGGGRGRTSGNSQPGPFSQSWTSSSTDPMDPIWQNATWEDWERFYARRAREEAGPSAASAADPPQPRGLYMPNSTFIALVVILAMMGGSANYSRAQDAGAYFVEQRDLVHDRAAKDLRKVRQEMSGMKGRDERIQWFLRQREAQMGQMGLGELEGLREEKMLKVLPEAEVCRSDGVSGK